MRLWGSSRACRALEDSAGLHHASPRPRRGRGEAGQLGGLEALVFGVLIFVFGTLVIANAWGVLDSKAAVSSAAVDATRAFVQNEASSPAVAAENAASQAISDSGRSVARMKLSIGGTPARCGTVTAVIRYRVPLISVPLLGGFGHSFTVASTHAELLDAYRSGLPGEATCAPES